MTGGLPSPESRREPEGIMIAVVIFMVFVILFFALGGGKHAPHPAPSPTCGAHHNEMCLTPKGSSTP